MHQNFVNYTQNTDKTYTSITQKYLHEKNCLFTIRVYFQSTTIRVHN